MDIFDPTIDTYLAYLPLAHVLEFTVEQLALYLGIPIGYGVQNRSKGNATSVGMCWNCSISCGGISELQPTIMAGVPEVFEGIRKAIENNVSRQGALQKYLFRSAFTLRKKLIESNGKSRPSPHQINSW
jgi:long-chain acyl-CoA synthetase